MSEARAPLIDESGVLPAKASRDDVLARIAGHPITGDTPEEMRSAFAALFLHDGRLARPDSPMLGCRISKAVGGVGGLVVVPERPLTGRRIIWLHGGGYVFGSPETHIRAAAQLARLTQTCCILPRYRLAPEHTWPAPLDDAFAAVRAGMEDGDRVLLAGDSAGGHLALVTALALARAGTPLAGLALFSPNTDRTGLSDTRRRMEDADPMVDDAGDRAFAEKMFPDREPADPQVSPVLDDLSLLPPTHIEVGDPEVLLGDARLLHERGRTAGADVTLHVEPGLTHMGQLWTPYWPAATASLERAARHVERVFG